MTCEGVTVPLEWVFGARLPWSGVWLNRHYLAREIAQREHVVYVLDPLPARPSRRLRRRAHDRNERMGDETAPERVVVVRPPDLPLQRLSVVARANRATGERLVRSAQAMAAPVVVVQFPRARLFARGALGEELTVYYCSDDFRRRADGSVDREFCEWEDEMLAQADLVIGVSRALCDDLSNRHARVRLVENGVDPSLFRPQCAATPDDIAAISGPRIGFVGSVREPLIDLGMMAAMAARRPGWSFCLVGWYDHDDAGIAALRALPNVHVLGPRPRERLSAYLSAMDVLTCPYPACDVTAVASPLKVYEALAVGVPLVALHAPTIEHLAPHVRNTDSIEAFEATLAEMLTSPPEPDAEVLRSVAWASRAETFRGHVVDALEG